MGQVVHASAVSVEGRGLLILGASGTGKSTLALRMIGLGARLVADDQTLLHAENGVLWARCPPPLSGLIEARGLGLLNAPNVPSARVELVVDLDLAETDRLPPMRKKELAGVTLSLVLGQRTDHFHVGLMHLMKYGRRG